MLLKPYTICLVSSVKLMYVISSLDVLHASGVSCFLKLACSTSSPHLFDLQADEARKYGARVYCVGIKDFDEQQVRQIYFTLCVLNKYILQQEAPGWKGVKKVRHM